jgi:hypothetical protein
VEALLNALSTLTVLGSIVLLAWGMVLCIGGFGRWERDRVGGARRIRGKHREAAGEDPHDDRCARRSYLGGLRFPRRKLEL